MTWPQISESTFPTKIPSHSSWKTAQLSKMLCNNAPLKTQRFELNVLLLELPGVVSSLNLLKALSLFREYLISFLWFLNRRVFDKFIQFKAASRVLLIIFIALVVSPTASWRVWPSHCVKLACDSISFMHVATPVLALTKLDALS